MAFIIDSNELSKGFSDNFFDLLPGEVKKIRLVTSNDVTCKTVAGGLRVRSLVDAFRE